MAQLHDDEDCVAVRFDAEHSDDVDVLRLELLRQQKELTHGALLPAPPRFGNLLHSYVGAHFLGAQALDGDTAGHRSRGTTAKEGGVARGAVEAVLQEMLVQNDGSSSSSSSSSPDKSSASQPRLRYIDPASLRVGA